jgi:hypothetical protein
VLGCGDAPLIIGTRYALGSGKHLVRSLVDRVHDMGCGGVLLLQLCQQSHAQHVHVCPLLCLLLARHVSALLSVRSRFMLPVQAWHAEVEICITAEGSLSLTHAAASTIKTACLPDDEYFRPRPFIFTMNDPIRKIVDKRNDVKSDMRAVESEPRPRDFTPSESGPGKQRRRSNNDNNSSFETMSYVLDELDRLNALDRLNKATEINAASGSRRMCMVFSQPVEGEVKAHDCDTINLMVSGDLEDSPKPRQPSHGERRTSKDLSSCLESAGSSDAASQRGHKPTRMHAQARSEAASLDASSGHKGVPGSARWLKECNETLEEERLSLVKQTLEVQSLLDSVKQKVRTARDMADMELDDGQGMAQSERMLDEKQELISRMIVQSQQAFFMAMVSRGLLF